MNGNALKLISASLLLVVSTLLAAPVAAQGHAEGKLVVKGKPVAITRAYAYTEADPFDEKKRVTVVLLCDVPLSAAAVRDQFEEVRKDLVSAGKLSCVQQRIDSAKQVINFGVRNKNFGARQPDGGSTEHIFEAKTFDGKTIAGRAHTKSPQMSFDDIPYSYDITFSADIESGR
jgi:hypothetical protein